MAAPSDPVVTSDPGTSEAGRTRKLLLDEMLAERARPPLPPAPVLTVEPAAVDAAPISGIRGARKRLVEVEALARRNLRAAEEARRVVHEERQLLEEEASARTEAERTASALRRELERLRSTEEQRAAQARFAATHEARSELATEIERVHAEHAQVVDELDRLRGTLFDHDSLLDEYSRRLREEQEAQAKALGDQLRAEEALRVVERNLEIATESSRRRAEEELARFNKVEDAWREACLERDRAVTELRSITTGDGELARLRAENAAAHEDATRLLADLDVQAARADVAEAGLAEATTARVEAERISATATEERDLAGIALETTRSELAERTEALDAERSHNQSRIADLVAQLATATRTAESATERSADLEARLDAATAARDKSVSAAEALAEQLARSKADTEVLRTQAASIGDELAETQRSLDKSKEALDTAREEAKRAADETRAAREERVIAPLTIVPDAPGNGTHPEASVQALPETPDVAPSSFDAALASAFGQEPGEPEVDVIHAGRAKAPAKTPKTVFKTIDPEADPVPRVRPGGPVVELEASLVRASAQVEAAVAPETAEVADADSSAPTERSPETQAWRRTAMAELTALATDSDDLTPRRRKS